MREENVLEIKETSKGGGSKENGLESWKSLKLKERNELELDPNVFYTRVDSALEFH